MSSENSITKDSIIEKFEFFFIGLIFTVLGASIQTANFTNSPSIVIILELISWLLFLVSGLVGINKLEWFPNIVYLRDKVQNRKRWLSDLRAMSKVNSKILIAETREYRDIHKIIDKGNELSEKYEEEFQKLIKKHKRKNSIQRWCFYFGFVFVSGSRSLEHILNLLS